MAKLIDRMQSEVDDLSYDQGNTSFFKKRIDFVFGNDGISVYPEHAFDSLRVTVKDPFWGQHNPKATLTDKEEGGTLLPCRSIGREVEFTAQAILEAMDSILDELRKLIKDNVIFIAAPLFIYHWMRQNNKASQSDIIICPNTGMPFDLHHNTVTGATSLTATWAELPITDEIKSILNGIPK